MRLALAVAAFAVLAPPAFAQEVDCTEPQTQTALNLCAAADLDAADAKLNALYGQARERLSGEEGKLLLLRDAQRGWIAYRDAECAFRSSGVAGGSAEVMVGSQCRADLTGKRAADLDAYLACEEGDMACPIPAR